MHNPFQWDELWLDIAGTAVCTDPTLSNKDPNIAYCPSVFKCEAEIGINGMQTLGSAAWTGPKLRGPNLYRFTHAHVYSNL